MEHLGHHYAHARTLDDGSIVDDFLQVRDCLGESSHSPNCGMTVAPNSEACVLFSAQLTANDAQTKLLEHVSREKLSRLEIIKERITKLGHRSSAAVEMLTDIESVIL